MKLTIIADDKLVSKDGVGYSMVGLMPEMKGKIITIYGHYYDKVDSVKIEIH